MNKFDLIRSIFGILKSMANEIGMKDVKFSFKYQQPDQIGEGYFITHKHTRQCSLRKKHCVKFIFYMNSATCNVQCPIIKQDLEKYFSSHKIITTARKVSLNEGCKILAYAIFSQAYPNKTISAKLSSQFNLFQLKLEEIINSST